MIHNITNSVEEPVFFLFYFYKKPKPLNLLEEVGAGKHPKHGSQDPVKNV
jgi:hypothetical protein